MKNIFALLAFLSINYKLPTIKKIKNNLIMKGGQDSASTSRDYFIYISYCSLLVTSLFLYSRHNCVLGVLKRNKYDIITRQYTGTPTKITIFVWQNSCWRRYEQNISSRATATISGQGIHLDKLDRCGLISFGKAPTDLCLYLNPPTATLTNNKPTDRVVAFELS